MNVMESGVIMFGWDKNLKLDTHGLHYRVQLQYVIWVTAHKEEQQ